MKVVVTKKEEFEGKKNGVKYVKLSYIRLTGETGEVFTTEDKFNSFSVDESVFVTPEALKGILGDADTVDVEFDQKGYVVGIE